jgi:predicted AlkP superfamily pyrophosphatase or phosphodiesterase
MLSATCMRRTVARGSCAAALLGALALAWLFATAAALAGKRERPASAGSRPAAVVMISLDGTTREMLERAGAKALLSLARDGAAVDHFEPAFPSNTFPNHVTLVTGVEPQRHGIVNNSFRDPERGEYDKDADPRWIESEPLWSLLAEQGIASASYHWVGSEGAWTSGRGPREWRKFDTRTPVKKKLEQVVAWLADSGAPDPIRFVTCYLPGADRAGHAHGPAAEEVSEALREQDAELGRFIAELDARGWFRSLTLFVVSDHGMAQVERNVDLRGALAEAGLRPAVFGASGFASVHVGGARNAASRAVRAARAVGLEAYPRERAPASWPVRNPRFGDVVVAAPIGTAIASSFSKEGFARGMHGYRTDLPEMGALFLARGRGVGAGTRIEHARAVDVAPTVLELLGAPEPAGLDGRSLARELAGARGSR